MQSVLLPPGTPEGGTPLLYPCLPGHCHCCLFPCTPLTAHSSLLSPRQPGVVWTPESEHIPLLTALCGSHLNWRKSQSSLKPIRPCTTALTSTPLSFLSPSIPELQHTSLITASASGPLHWLVPLPEMPCSAPLAGPSASFSSDIPLPDYPLSISFPHPLCLMKILCCIYLFASWRHLPHNVTSLRPRDHSLLFTHCSRRASQQAGALAARMPNKEFFSFQFAPMSDDESPASSSAEE